jgi:hypothetical protein
MKIADEYKKRSYEIHSIEQLIVNNKAEKLTGLYHELFLNAGKWSHSRMSDIPIPITSAQT